MYLSQLILNDRGRRVNRDLANVYELHRTVMSGFAPTLPPEERVLFRLDEDRTGRLVLLVQSHTAPDWSALPEGYLQAADPFAPVPNPAVKSFGPAFHDGQRLRFRLRANPTVKISRPGRQQGYRVGIINEERQLAWLAGKGERGGFRLEPDKVRVGQPGRDRGFAGQDARSGKRHKVELHVVVFEGLLQVTDAAAFARTLQAGIGSAKGFGCGLLSLALA